MNYIGSKLKLSSFIKDTVMNTVGNIEEMVFCDIFAGTGIVGRTFKPLVKRVISNDIEYYSYVLNKNYIANAKTLKYMHLIEELNNLKLIEGFIYKHYSLEGQGQRQYFSSHNAKKIDTIRQKIEAWKDAEEIDEDMYYFLLASLIESADKIANTASVYAAYLKRLKKTAQKDFLLAPALFDAVGADHRVYHDDANHLIKSISGDILYMDPPYNQRQYGSNYHLLNTIAKYDEFEPQGKTGLREYNRSAYCKKSDVLEAFEALIKDADFRYIFLSYNNEGLMSANEVENIMKKYGDYRLKTMDYQRFKADKTASRNHKASSTVEYLHILVKC